MTQTAFSSPRPGGLLADATDRLRRHGARRMVSPRHGAVALTTVPGTRIHQPASRWHNRCAHLMVAVTMILTSRGHGSRLGLLEGLANGCPLARGLDCERAPWWLQ